VVLCGGRSSRMGTDKATMIVEGAAMAVRVAAAMRDGGVTTVAAIGGDGPALAALGLAVVSDQHPGEGPLGGIVTAFAAFPDADALLVASCDLPWLNAATVRMLVAALGRHEAAVAVGERREPLCALWRASSAPDIAAAFAGGERAVHRVLASLDVVDVAVDPEAVRNVNTPVDLCRGTRDHEG
jgi:molybdopterin-guanine dinucleotide biosynthesis protein A